MVMTDRKQWRTGLSVGFVGQVDESVMEAYAKAQIKSMEISLPAEYYDNGLDWKNLPKWSKNTGTETWSIHLPIGRMLIAYKDRSLCDDAVKRYCEYLDKAGEAGIKVAVVHPSGEPIHDTDRPDMMQLCLDNLGILCERAKQVGMQIAVEVLPRTCLCNCQEEVKYFLDRLPDLRVCLDTNHLLKETSQSMVRAAGDKIITLHVSDYDFVDEKHSWPGDGLIDWKSLQDELEKADYNGPFLYELSPRDMDGRRTLEDLRANHLWLMNL
jgi:sugar phosphate isomerase/epimerase